MAIALQNRPFSIRLPGSTDRTLCLRRFMAMLANPQTALFEAATAGTKKVTGGKVHIHVW